MRRLICCVLPARGTENDILASEFGSLGIIGSELFLLIRHHVSQLEVRLYNEELDVRPDDILLLLTCLNKIPDGLLERYRNVIYYFDDLNIWKYEDYLDFRQVISSVAAICHPVRDVAEGLQGKVGKPVYYIPWSISRLPQLLPPKSVSPSFFIDLDTRIPQSVTRAHDFIRMMAPLDLQLSVPGNTFEHLEVSVRPYLSYVGQMRHMDYLNAIGSHWFYVSGIEGSYEYTVLESAFLGCGRVSLGNAIRTEHVGERSFFATSGSEEGTEFLTRITSSFDPEAIRQEAPLLYPPDATKTLMKVIADVFG